MDITFANPEWLYGLLVIPFLIAYYYYSVKKKKSVALKFSSLYMIKKAASKKTSYRRGILFWLSITALCLLLIALADPHIPLKHTKKGVNVVLAIDVSGSMQATDYKPNRLEAAKAAASTLIKELNPKDNVGIVVFENGATTACYLTPFKKKALEKLKAIKSKQGATAIGDGLSLAIDMATSIPNKKKVVILLSDGVNNAGVISPDEAIQFAKDNRIQVFTIGLGSEKPVVLGYDWFGRPQYAKLDEAELKKIAHETGGEYYKSVNEKTLKNIYKNLNKKIKREKENTSIRDWFLIALLIVLITEFYLRYGPGRVIP